MIVQFAVMPCCHKDHQGSLKEAAKSLDMPLGVLMDVALLGRIQATPGYHCVLKTVDAKITPQNRIIVAVTKSQPDEKKNQAIELAEQKLAKAYHRAHRHGRKNAEACDTRE